MSDDLQHVDVEAEARGERRLAKLDRLKLSLPAYSMLLVARARAPCSERAAAAAAAAPKTPPHKGHPVRQLEALVQQWKRDLQNVWFPRFTEDLHPPGLGQPEQDRALVNTSIHICMQLAFSD